MNRIVMTQPLCQEGYRILEAAGDIWVANNPNPSTYLEQMADADAIVVRIGHMTREEIEESPKLRVIGRPGVGYDSIDVEAATARGIPIVITPGANADAVAEHTLAMILALASNLVEAHEEALLGNFAIRDSTKAFELRGKTVGIVGAGNIGSRVARMCLALGMRVCVYDINLSQETVENRGYGYCPTLGELLAQSDVVTIHTPFDDSTRGMLTLQEIRRMKPTSILVNCARGGIIIEKDLLTALNEESIAGAGVDVFFNEPLKPGDPLFQAKNLIVSPHSAGMAREAVVRMAEVMARGCVDVMNGIRCPHVANPEVYGHPRWRG